MQHRAATVLVGTGSLASLGAAMGSALGVVRAQPAMPLAFQAGVNTGLFSFCFFATREYAVRPALSVFDPSPSTSRHTHDFVPTSTAGFISGALYSAYFRGLKTAPKAGFTVSLASLVVQSAYNELGVLRIKALSWEEDRRTKLAGLDAQEVVGDFKTQPPTYTRDIASPLPTVGSRETFSERSDRLFGEAWEWTKKKAGRLAPMKKMEEGEYEDHLRKRIREIEDEEGAIRREIKELLDR
ncbi:hypothetical protein MNV49_006886 [Pseudohyphozyma bogoriensis]|nr:hypothetical protein MNV49_006886 [Pseudohyphozyma bogoriensis]